MCSVAVLIGGITRAGKVIAGYFAKILPVFEYFVGPVNAAIDNGNADARANQPCVRIGVAAI